MRAPCPACELVAGRRVPPGGVLWRGDGLVAHAVDGPTPLLGWAVVTPEAHVRSVFDLPPDVATRLYALAHRVHAAQRAALGAAHGYVAAFGEVLLHAHVHVIPRYADTPADLRGPKAFLAPPAAHRPADEVAAAARALARALGTPG